jgi:hypothetical protein
MLYVYLKVYALVCFYLFLPLTANLGMLDSQLGVLDKPIGNTTPIGAMIPCAYLYGKIGNW